ncbi:serine hydrolase [Streptomyces wuyuanensis]
MTGVPARPGTHFRAGSVAIVPLGIVLLQPVDERKARLDDPLSRRLPGAPHVDRTTLRAVGSHPAPGGH